MALLPPRCSPSPPLLIPLLCAVLCAAAAPALADKPGRGADPVKPAAAARSDDSTGKAARGDAGKSDAPAVDPAESAYLTRAYIFVDAPGIERYVRTVAQRLLTASAVRMPAPDVLIQSSDSFDCFTDSRGNLVISTGALRELASEDELAAVLGHELSHLILRHPQAKDAMRAFPLGLETASYVAIAANRLDGSPTQAYSGNLNRFGESGLLNAQAASLLWSDILAPSWNRRQERAADENGLLLMRAAGYNPSAFGTLFQRLHVAGERRSDRMEMLRKVMLGRVRQQQQRQQQRSRSDADSNAVTQKVHALGDDLRNTMTEKAVEGVIEGLTSFNREYDPPRVRQENLARFAQQHRLKGRPPAKPASQLREALHGGAGGALLALDAAAIRALEAMNARRLPAAREAIGPVLAASPGGVPPSPHLNLALGAWEQLNGHPERGEAHARAWLAARRPPANAYVWLAYYQYLRREYEPSMKTLERGRRRVGSGAPFLPHLVSVARTAGQEQRAEKYALDCQEEDRRNTSNAVAAFFGNNRVPSGLYADCVARLGHEPRPQGASGAALQALKHPIDSSKGLAAKIRDKFRSRDAK
ncbi:MAG: M48 family metallopeptidase [Steroidobacteraceae bacterium]